ncbi:hypothetical protein BOX15_Mlig034601g3, partial [Macrostomum lignano]
NIASPNSDNVNDDLWIIVNELIDDLTMDTIFSCHMEAKMGLLMLDEELATLAQTELSPVSTQRQQQQQQSAPICRCPNCHRRLAASRLAPHLEKCMGMGRLASRRRPLQQCFGASDAAAAAELAAIEDSKGPLLPRKRRRCRRNSSPPPPPQSSVGRRRTAGVSDKTVEFDTVTASSDSSSMTN